MFLHCFDVHIVYYGSNLPMYAQIKDAGSTDGKGDESKNDSKDEESSKFREVEILQLSLRYLGGGYPTYATTKRHQVH